MKLALATLALALTPALAFAQTVDKNKVAADIAKIAAYLPANSALAGTFVSSWDAGTNKVVARTGDELLQSVAQSYLLADFNKDGKQDLAIVAEANPSKADDGSEAMGARTLIVFLGNGTTFSQIAEGSKIIYDGESGGMMGDPFMGLEVSKQGSIKASLWGGSADKWGYTSIFSVRGNDVKLVGFTSMQSGYEMKANTVVIRTKDTNLVTGNQIETAEKMESEKGGKKIVRKIKVKPLISLKDANMDDLSAAY